MMLAVAERLLRTIYPPPPREERRRAAVMTLWWWWCFFGLRGRDVVDHQRSARVAAECKMMRSLRHGRVSHSGAVGRSTCRRRGPAFEDEARGPAVVEGLPGTGAGGAVDDVALSEEGEEGGKGGTTVGILGPGEFEDGPEGSGEGRRVGQARSGVGFGVTLAMVVGGVIEEGRSIGNDGVAEKRPGIDVGFEGIRFAAEDLGCHVAEDADERGIGSSIVGGATVEEPRFRKVGELDGLAAVDDPERLRSDVAMENTVGVDDAERSGRLDGVAGFGAHVCQRQPGPQLIELRSRSFGDGEIHASQRNDVVVAEAAQYGHFAIALGRRPRRVLFRRRAVSAMDAMPRIRCDDATELAGDQMNDVGLEDEAVFALDDLDALDTCPIFRQDVDAVPAV
eukprot:CAMPEP_0197424532 /NCGR_PEP_ID=MMETSP1170-20131217/26654_1 /TAXON_ID=54406 /ORGANISM="Sarcinochrysis sp, Strain CCMP770" /LENGTH=394 /DNA_ID=CAMNT_0042952017 /DNA_START=32 /DNA_END=1212 /DNA_ORIENTATION=+